MTEPAYPLAFLEGDEGQAWPAQGEWTYEDYLRLPEDGRRYEVIRGHLYVTAAPRFEHQSSVTQLTLKLGGFVSEHKLGLVLVAPFDILLPERIGDPVEPDILYFRPENRPRRGDKNFRGVPDLVVEVLSPRTRLYDRKIKLGAYEEAGIPEYWLVDPWARTVEVFGFREGAGATSSWPAAERARRSARSSSRDSGWRSTICSCKRESEPVTAGVSTSLPPPPPAPPAAARTIR